MLSFIHKLVEYLKPRQELVSHTVGWKPQSNKGVRVFLVSGSYTYEQQQRLGVNAPCLFIRATYKGEWFKVSPNMQPIGRPIGRETTQKWDIIQEVV